LRERNTVEEKLDVAHNFQKDSGYFQLLQRAKYILGSIFLNSPMNTFIKTLLLISTITLLTFIGIKSSTNSDKYIEISKDISKLQDTDHMLGEKVEKLLEKLTVGIYDKYSQKKSKIKQLENDANDYKEKSTKLIYYFFGTILIIGLIFLYIDYEFLILFIGFSSLVSLFFGLTSTLILIVVHKALPVLGMVTLSFETKSIIGTIQKLYEHKNYIIALIVLLFSIIIPLVKTLVILLYGFLKESGLGKNIIKTLDKLGKWSMADVFIVAFLVVFFSTKQDIHSSLVVESGLYFFLGYVLLSMIGSTLMSKTK